MTEMAYQAQQQKWGYSFVSRTSNADTVGRELMSMTKMIILYGDRAIRVVSF